MRKVRKITARESREVCTQTMSKAMSDWFDERINSGQFTRVYDGNKSGIACKSRDCTIVLFPNWNCVSQFRNIVNKMR